MQPPAEAIRSESKSEGESAFRSFSFRERLQLLFITWTGYLFIRLIGPTLRFTVECEPGAMSDGAHVDRAIWCFWHRCVIPAAYRFRNNKIAVMTSRSFDGEYIARIIRKFGYGTVRGSSSRGAVGALIGMRRELDAGNPVAFTIDGPRGPRYVAKPGPVLLAKKTGCAIGCFYIALENAWVLNSWDAMIIPKPFSRATLHVSSPICVPPETTDEEMNKLHQEMQQALERCRERAEAACVHSPHPNHTQTGPA